MKVGYTRIVTISTDNLLKTNLELPHTLVLEPGLTVYKIYMGYWFWGRPSIAELWADLREVTRRIRPDWDITDPQLRAAWERGERTRFFPYGRSFHEVWGEHAES